LKLKYDDLLSNLASKINLRRYMLVHLGVKALGRYMRGTQSGAARNAARLAAENRARKSDNANHYL